MKMAIYWMKTKVNRRNGEEMKDGRRQKNAGGINTEFRDFKSHFAIIKSPIVVSLSELVIDRRYSGEFLESGQQKMFSFSLAVFY